MKTELTNYEVYPKVVLAGKETALTIRPLGAHAAFHDDTHYTLRVIPMNETNLNDPAHSYASYELCSRDGTLRANCCFGGEGQYGLLIKPEEPLPNPGNNPALPAGLRPQELRVYAVEEDLFRLRPFRGDMHVHSFCSDGREEPAIVAANYRKGGFDFFALTDHFKYEPSLEAAEAYRNAPVDLRIFPGEEVHAPGNNTHYINFAGKYSINGTIRGDPDRYKKEITELAESLEIPPGLNKAEYASAYWICREIHRAEGLAIMVHPHWIHTGAYHVPEKMSVAMLKAGLFDAFELIGGQGLRENLPQVSLWQQLRAEGNRIPVVGSSDSHGTVNSTLFQLGKTIVFAEHCERDEILEAIQKGRTAALEQYGGESLPRIYGEYRYVMFALFLEDEYFPLHDELCFEEGRLMKEYICGDQGAAVLLGSLQGRCSNLLKKYWGDD